MTPAEVKVVHALAAFAAAVQPRPALTLITARTNGAPGSRPGTPPTSKTDGWKEPRSMHTVQSETTPRGRQILAAITLAHLLESDPLADRPGAPLADWRIDATGRIHGHVHDPHSDANARAALHEYAGFLGLAGVEHDDGHNEHSAWTHLSASATYRGVPVNVWTHVGIHVTNPYSSFGGTR